MRGFSTARHPRGSNATEGSCAAHKLVGGHSVHPRLWESNFSFGKSQRLLRRSPCGARVLHRLASVDCYNSLELARLPQQNFAALRMTCSRGVAFCTLRVHGVPPYTGKCIAVLRLTRLQMQQQITDFRTCEKIVMFRARNDLRGFSGISTNKMSIGQSAIKVFCFFFSKKKAFFI